MLSRKKIQEIANQIILVDNLSNNELVEFCEFANQKYRNGNPIISDENYDFIIIPELKKRFPYHPFLKKIEAEIEGFSEEKIKLPEKMLSTDKAYSWEEINKWLEELLSFQKKLIIL